MLLAGWWWGSGFGQPHSDWPIRMSCEQICINICPPDVFCYKQEEWSLWSFYLLQGCSIDLFSVTLWVCTTLNCIQAAFCLSHLSPNMLRRWLLKLRSLSILQISSSCLLPMSFLCFETPKCLQYKVHAFWVECSELKPRKKWKKWAMRNYAGPLVNWWCDSPETCRLQILQEQEADRQNSIQPRKGWELLHTNTATLQPRDMMPKCGF